MSPYLALFVGRTTTVAKNRLLLRAAYQPHYGCFPRNIAFENVIIAEIVFNKAI